MAKESGEDGGSDKVGVVKYVGPFPEFDGLFDRKGIPISIISKKC